MKARRIFFLPWGDKNIASSRLRVHNVIPHMKNAMLGVPETYEKGDVLIIQKALRHDEVDRAQKAGVPVIYDIDDNYLDRADFVKMSVDADMVTVGSSFFHRYFPDAPVIDDSLDWDGTIKTDYTQNKLAGWHGYGTHAYIKNIAPILENRGYKIRTIVGKEYIPEYGKYEVREWNQATIDSDLAECDFCVLPLPSAIQDFDDFTQSKGMNKLIKSWAIGLPTFFNYMPEYDRVVKESGIRGYMVGHWETHDLTKPWIPEMREYALKFKPEAIAEQWEAAIKLL